MPKYEQVKVGMRLRYSVGPCESMEAVVTALKPVKGNFDNAEVVFEDGSRSTLCRLDLVNRTYWVEIDVISPSKLREVRAFADYYAARPDAVARNADMFRKRAVEQVVLDFAHLEPSEPEPRMPFGSPCANIKRHLKKLYPDSRFSVRTRRHSIQVEILEGDADEREVSAVLDIFVSGRRAMSDAYVAVPAVFRTIYGASSLILVDSLRRDAKRRAATHATFPD